MKKIALLLLVLSLSFGTVFAEDWGKEITASISEITKKINNGVESSITVEQCEVNDEKMYDLKAYATIQGRTLATTLNFEYHHKNLSKAKPDLYFDFTILPAKVDLESIGGLTKEDLIEIFNAFTAEENPEAFKLSIPKWRSKRGILVDAEVILQIDCTKFYPEENADVSYSDATLRLRIKKGQIFASFSGNLASDEVAEEMNNLTETLKGIKEKDPEIMSWIQEFFEGLSEDFLDTEEDYLNTGLIK